MAKDTFNIQKFKADPIADTADLVYNEELGAYETKFVRPKFSDGSDAYANNYKAYLSFQNVRNEEHQVFFKAFITAFNESFTPNFNPTEVFGRTDPIMQYKNTTRNITLAWKMPAASESEAFENLAKTQVLLQMLYPSYTDVSNSLTLSEAPLVRLKLMNLLQKSDSIQPSGNFSSTDAADFGRYQSRVEPKFGLLGVITSCNVNHNLEGAEGVFHKFDEQGNLQSNTVLPKLIDINISFTPLHEETLGYSNREDMQNIETFPYRIRPGLGILGTTPVPAAPQRGKSLSELREIKRTLEEKRRTAASAQQKADKAQAAARRAMRKLSKGKEISEKQMDKVNESLESSFGALESAIDLAQYEESGDGQFEDLL